ncbi:hypothetical protein Tco_0366538 [Tanacetum coccineum]
MSTLSHETVITGFNRLLATFAVTTLRLHRLLSPTEPLGQPMMRRYLREVFHGVIPHNLSQPRTGYVTESDPEEDPEEYEDDETEDGPVDYPMDGGDDGDDDDGDSSRDDVNDEDEDDEDEEKEEEEEHLAPADSTIVVPVDELALIDAVTAALPSPPLPPLPPSLYIPPLVDHRDEIPESEQLPRKRPTRGREIDYGFVSTIDAEEKRQGIRDVGVTELAEIQEHDTQDLYALLEDAQDSRSRISQRVDMDSQRVDLLIGDKMTLQETVWMVEEEAYAHQTQLQLLGTLIQTHHQVHETRFQMQQAELAALRENDCRRQAQMAETLRVIRDMRQEMSDMQVELLALREQQRRARQPRPETRIPDHQDTSGDADSHI